MALYQLMHLSSTLRAQVHELAQGHCGHNQEGALFSRLRIYCAHLISVRFVQSVCFGSLMINLAKFFRVTFSCQCFSDFLFHLLKQTRGIYFQLSLQNMFHVPAQYPIKFQA